MSAVVDYPSDAAKEYFVFVPWCLGERISDVVGLMAGKSPRAKARETKRFRETALQNAPQFPNDSPKW